MPPISVIFFSSFCIFLFFLTPNVNTGDGGEFATVAQFLGVAHPSGYPLYLLLAKAITFLPMGNMAFRVSLLSALFGALSLSLLFSLVKRITSSGTSALFAVTVLFTSYSFFSQSVIAKFYTLNLFVIILVFALYVSWLQNASRPLLTREVNEGRPWHLYLIAFLIGLSLVNHHTGIIIAGPVFLGLILRRPFPFRLRTILGCAALILLGYLVNMYVVIRGWEGRFFSGVYINDLKTLYEVLSRQAYKDSGTISAIQQSAGNLPAYWYGLKHFSEIIVKNFSLYSFLLFLSGCFFLAKKNWRVFVVAIASLILYGPLIARITMGSESLSETSYYISANQYFVPAMAFYALFLGLGLRQCTLWLEKLNLSLIAKAIPVVMALFPLVFLVSRATDSNYRTNYVAYQLTKDMYSVLPVRSMMLTFGDNASYQSWYLKVLGRYREDVGQISSPEQKEILWSYQGCRSVFYKDIFPMVYTRKFQESIPLLLGGRFYGTDPVKPGQAYERYIKSKPFSVINLYYPVDKYLKDKPEAERKIDDVIQKRLPVADRVVTFQPCLSHLTDDLFTRRLCSQYSLHMTDMARLYSGNRWGKTGDVMEVKVQDDAGHVQSYYTDITRRNEPYYKLFSLIQDYNQWPILYLRK